MCITFRNLWITAESRSRLYRAERLQSAYWRHSSRSRRCGQQRADAAASYPHSRGSMWITVTVRPGPLLEFHVKLALSTCCASGWIPFDTLPASLPLTTLPPAHVNRAHLTSRVARISSELGERAAVRSGRALRFVDGYRIVSREAGTMFVAVCSTWNRHVGSGSDLRGPRSVT